MKNTSHVLVKLLLKVEVTTKPVDLVETHVELYRFLSVDQVFSLYH